jgi:uncharacterized protein (DUF924 family)
MLLRKPDGMCTISNELGDKKVVLGFNTAEQAREFRNQAVDRTIDATVNGKPREQVVALAFTNDERKSVTAQTIVECLERMHEDAKTLHAWGHRELAAILQARAETLQNEINAYLNTTQEKKEHGQSNQD